MCGMSEKTITIRIDEDFHKNIKMEIAKRGISLKEYVVNLLKEDLKKHGNLL